jgi:hypothetical protein
MLHSINASRTAIVEHERDYAGATFCLAGSDHAATGAAPCKNVSHCTSGAVAVVLSFASSLDAAHAAQGAVCYDLKYI